MEQETRGSLAADRTEEDERNIREFFDMYAKRWSSHDVTGWMELWDIEGVQMPPNDTMHTGKRAIRNANAPLIGDRSMSWDFSITTQEVILCGERFAIARGVYRLGSRSSEDGQISMMDGKFMSVLRRQPDGTWLLYRDCFNSNTPAQ